MICALCGNDTTPGFEDEVCDHCAYERMEQRAAKAEADVARTAEHAECPECGNLYQPWDRIWSGEKWRCRLCATWPVLELACTALERAYPDGLAVEGFDAAKFGISLAHPAVAAVRSALSRHGAGKEAK